MKPLDLRRHNDIIAFKSADDTIIGFHAYNLEIAEMSPESFEQMTKIDINTGAIPDSKLATDSETQEALSALDTWNNEVNSHVKNGKLDFGIRSITLNVNQICNLKCRYCAAGGDGTYGEPTNQLSIEKTLPQLKFFMNQIQPGRKFSISFVGGEPLLHPDAIHAIYVYVVNEAAKLNITPSLQIVTNGTLLSGRTLDIIRTMKINLTFSIDGSKKYNDIARPAKNGQSSTDMTVSAIKSILADRGQVQTVGFSAICSQDCPDMLDTYHFFETLKPDWIDFVFAYSEKSSDLNQRFIDDLSQIAKLAYQAGGEKKLRQIKTFDLYFRLLDNQQRLENFCGAGKTYLMVDAKNRLYTCPWDVGINQESVGHDEQYDMAKLTNYSKSLIELNNCQTCWARHLCGGGCMHINREHTGDKHKKNSLFCKRTRSLILVAIMYYKLARAA